MSENQPPTGDDDNRISESEDGFFSSWKQPTPAEQTRPLPPYQPPASSSATATRPERRRAGTLTAAVLAGALVLGGAAGVGGAAWYDAWNGDDTSAAGSSSDGSQIQANDPATSGSGGSSSAAAGSVEKVASTVLPSVVKINVTGSSESGSGSGIVLSSDGEILTNNHVVAVAGKSGSITVNFNDGTTAKASIVGTDPVTDLAVIKAAGVSGLTAAEIGKSSALQVGQPVVAVGSPYGLNATVTSGIVSALNRPVSVATADEQEQGQSPQFPFGDDGEGGGSGGSGGQSSSSDSTTYPAVQTDAAINPGNSGGPLVNMSGQVIGINSSIRTGSDSSSSESGGSVGLGFAIPIDEVLPIVNQLVNNQTPTHARLGVTVSDVSGSATEQGAQIQSVASGDAGDDAGLRKGDVITKVDDDPIDGSESLVATVRGHRPGDTVRLTYVRDGATKTLDAKLGTDAGKSGS